MILGIGTDLVEIARVEAVWRRFGARFVERVLAPAERERLAGLALPGPWLAKRFAAKEAAAKALGTGFSTGVGFHDLLIHNDPAGRPLLALYGAAEAHAARLGVVRAHLSLSDTHAHAMAFVVLEGRCDLTE